MMEVPFAYCLKKLFSDSKYRVAFDGSLRKPDRIIQIDKERIVLFFNLDIRKPLN